MTTVEINQHILEAYNAIAPLSDAEQALVLAHLMREYIMSHEEESRKPILGRMLFYIFHEVDPSMVEQFKEPMQ